LVSRLLLEVLQGDSRVNLINFHLPQQTLLVLLEVMPTQSLDFMGNGGLLLAAGWSGART